MTYISISLKLGFTFYYGFSTKLWHRHIWSPAFLILVTIINFFATILPTFHWNQILKELCCPDWNEVLQFLACWKITINDFVKQLHFPPPLITLYVNFHINWLFYVENIVNKRTALFGQRRREPKAGTSNFPYQID